MKQFVWLLILCLAAGVTTLAQLDRQSRYAPDVSALVPETFRSFAQYHAATAALEKADERRAMDAAQLLVARRPMPAENIRTLAQAQLLAGDTEVGAQTIQAAARRGWRDLASQQAMLMLALAAKDDTEAVRRYLAIWVTQDDKSVLDEYTPRVFASDAALDEAERLLAVKSRWRTGFLRDGTATLPLQSAMTILTRMKGRGISPSCDELARIVETQIRGQVGKPNGTAQTRAQLLSQLGC